DQIIVYDTLNNNDLAVVTGTNPSLSGSGQYLAFEFSGDIRILDNIHNNITVAYIPIGGLAGKRPSISADGNFVTFFRPSAEALSSAEGGDILVTDIRNHTTITVFQSFFGGSDGE